MGKMLLGNPINRAHFEKTVADKGLIRNEGNCRDFQIRIETCSSDSSCNYCYQVSQHNFVASILGKEPVRNRVKYINVDK
jgi:hypothetical protein